MSKDATIADVLEGRARWCVVEGESLDVLRSLPANSIDALVTDPPYGIGEAAGKNKTRSNAAVAKDYGDDEWDNQPASPEIIVESRRVARTQIIFGGNYFALPPTPCWLVWDKLNTGDFADCELAWTNMSRAIRRIAYRWNGMIRANNEPRGLHPTQKPLGVMVWCLGLLGANDATVIDPFAGSGTTGVAALRTGRRVILVEREPKYAAICRERLEAESGGITIEAARAGQMPLLGGAA